MAKKCDNFDIIECEVQKNFLDQEFSNKQEVDTSLNPLLELKCELPNVIQKDNIEAIDITNENIKNHKCDFCDKVFNSLRNFNFHVKVLHDNIE